LKLTLSTITFLLCSICKPANAFNNVIKIAAIDWCPQICVNEEIDGYTVELVEQIYRDTGYKLEIDILPWSRAIMYVSDGKYDALLSPAKKEAPHLVYPEWGVGKQRMCFFVASDSSWMYKGEESLQGKAFGIANDTSIEELNDYIQAHSKQFQFQPYHERYVYQNAQKVIKNRIDAFIFTQNTTNYELSKTPLKNEIKNAGCVSEADIYLAFSPVEPKQHKIKKLVALFDERMKELVNNGQVAQLYKAYGIKQELEVALSLPSSD